MSLQPVLVQGKPVLRRSSATQTNVAQAFPAPTKGLDFVTPLAAMDPMYCTKASNVLARTYGLEFRSGWRRWATGIPGEVRTLMPYNPPRGLGVPADGKLFAAASDGKIYDVTVQTNEVTVPPVAVNIPGQLEPGEFSWTNFATLATNYLCVCSAGGGYWTYDATGGWVDRTVAITGPGSPFAINFDFVMSWKNRLWFIVNQTADTFYLQTNSIVGSASNFDFGPLLIHGGDLKAMASWTIDGGDGIDDKLVMVGSEGDLLVYEGTDPSAAATFRIIGRWFIGRPPNGRRFLARYGGDIQMITQFGVFPLSRMLTGLDRLEATEEKSSYRINPVLSDFIRATLLEQYWEVRYLPQLECIFINAPDGLETKNRQFVMDVNSRGWTFFDNIPMLTCENFGGQLYFGTLDGKVGKAFEGLLNQDDVLTDGTKGPDIQIDVQGPFVPGADKAKLNRFLQFEMTFQGVVPPAINAVLIPDWSSEAPPGSPIFLGEALYLWDSALWDTALWSSGQGNTYRTWIGASGIGSFAALRFLGKGAAKTLFVNYTIVTEPGGLM